MKSEKVSVGEGLAPPENKRISQNKQSACHSERRKTLAFCVVEVLRVERSEQAKPRSDSDEGIWLGALVAFFHKCNISIASHRDLQPYPASAKSLAVLYRIVAASGSLPQQNFDFGRRSDTPTSAQNDKQRLCFAIRVRKNGRIPILSPTNPKEKGTVPL